MCILYATQNWYIFTANQFLIYDEHRNVQNIHSFLTVKHLNTMYILFIYLLMSYKIGAIVFHLSV